MDSFFGTEISSKVPICQGPCSKFSFSKKQQLDTEEFVPHLPTNREQTNFYGIPLSFGKRAALRESVHSVK